MNKKDKIKQINQKLNNLIQEKRKNKEIQKTQSIQTKQLPFHSSQTLNHKLQELPQSNLIPKHKKIKKHKTIKKKLFSAAGKIWEDQSMLQWPENDYRIFCGNLGNQVTDDLLANAFRKYKSFYKAKVLRDKRTGKTRGFGFISLLDSQDFLKAMREMNGKYVGNRLIKLSKSKWAERKYDEQNQFLPSEYVKTKKNNSIERTYIFSNKL